MAKDKLISFGEQLSEKSLAPRFEFLVRPTRAVTVLEGVSHLLYDTEEQFIASCRNGTKGILVSTGTIEHGK